MSAAPSPDYAHAYPLPDRTFIETDEAYLADRADVCLRLALASKDPVERIYRAGQASAFLDQMTRAGQKAAKRTAREQLEAIHRAAARRRRKSRK